MKPNPGDPSGTRMVFTCKKESFEFLGQVDVDSANRELQVEVFNPHYFTLFEVDPAEVLEALKDALRQLLVRRGVMVHEPESNLSRVPGDDGIESAEPSPDFHERGGWDLQEMFDRLNLLYFEGKIEATIGWARATRGNNKRSIRFGSYHCKRRTISIHPRLNQSFVPACVVEMTVYHEMCHQHQPPIRENGQNRAHHASFKRKEREYPFYEQARAWEKRHWKKLLKVPG